VRIFLGFILGVIVTIAGTYAYDAQTGRSINGLAATAEGGQAPMVNWDVVSENWTSFQQTVRVKTGELERTLRRHVS
jgi:hypothetical protein